MDPILHLILFLCLKHLVADFLVQGPYMYKNKGNLLHPGGYLHAGYHVLLTFTILYAYDLPVSLLTTLLVFEFTAHYLIDFSKVNICKLYDLTATNSENYWRLMGLDQFLHMACYVIMVQAIINYAVQVN